MQIHLPTEFNYLYDIVSGVLAAGHRDRITQGQLLDIVHQLDGKIDTVSAADGGTTPDATPKPRRKRKPRFPVTSDVEEYTRDTAHLTLKEAAAGAAGGKGVSPGTMQKWRKLCGLTKPRSPGQQFMADAGFSTPDTTESAEASD